MPSIRNGSLHLFRFKGIDVFLNWSWLLVAIYGIRIREAKYSSPAWAVFEYLALFLIVLTHEFGHALACRQVGGTANRIMLWPFGGVAYVDPPQRPGATLWSIAAGPLVNVALLPFLIALFIVARMSGWQQSMHDVYVFVRAVMALDIVLLVFNILPIYPLDGGQMLRSMLWYIFGRARSLMVATILGFLGIILFIVLAVVTRDTWLGLISVYLLLSCWGGLQQARALWNAEKLPRREGFACPSCHMAPPLGARWKCGKCEMPFDTFENRAICPTCETQYQTTVCLHCGKQHPMTEWVVGNPMAGLGVLNGASPQN